MTAYTNDSGTSIDVPDELIGFLGPGWTKTGKGNSPTPAPAKPEPEEKPADTASDDLPEPPPRSGKGSSDANWTAYARSQNVKVTDEMTRKEIIAACEAADVPVE